MLLSSLMKKKTGSVFPTFCRATNFHHASIMCCNVSQVGYNCSNVSQTGYAWTSTKDEWNAQNPLYSRAFGPSSTHNLITRVLTISQMKLSGKDNE